MSLGNDHILLSQLLSRSWRVFSPEQAEVVLRLKFSAAERRRMTKLGELSNEGMLSTSQRAEYERFVHVASLLTLMKSRARLALAAAKLPAGRKAS